MAKEVKFEIVEHLCVLETFATGWTTEFNIVKWGDGEPKYDIRNWNSDHTKCSKGVTLFEYEMANIMEAYENHVK